MKSKSHHPHTRRAVLRSREQITAVKGNATISQEALNVNPSISDRKTFWLAVGTVLGMVIAYYCPQEPAYAGSASAAEKFSMCTVPVNVNASEAVFVLDNVTGRLIGALHSLQASGFNQTYQRNLAADFQVTENAQYLMVSGSIQVAGAGATPPAQGAIYVGELTSGIVNMYGFTNAPGGRLQAPKELIPIASFPFRGN